MVKKLVYVFILAGVVLFSGSPVFSDSFCLESLKGNPFQIPHNELENLRAILLEPFTVSPNKNFAEFLGRAGGKLRFKKVPGPWYSRQYAYSNSATPAGDLRLPIALFGPELSWLMGIRAYRSGTDWILEFPTMEELKTFTAETNAFLKLNGHEPISYLPVVAGFETDEGIMKIALSATGDFKLNFPLAQGDRKLIFHEVSYHLLGLMLNSEILNRTQELNRRGEDVRIFLRDRFSGPNRQLELISRGALRARTLDLDFGTANPLSSLAQWKLQNPLKSFKAYVPPDFAIASLKSLIRPGYSASEFAASPFLRYHTYAPLEQHAEVVRLLNEFIESHRQTDSAITSSSAEEIFQRLYKNLEVRISQIIAAATQAKIARLNRDRHSGAGQMYLEL